MHSQRPARRASRFPGVGCGVRRATQRFSSTAEHLNCGLRGAGWTSLRTSDPGCGVLSRPMSGTVELGTLGLSAAKLHSRHDRWPDLIVASAGRGFGPRLTGCLFPPGSPGIAAPWASLPSPAASPSLARRHRSAVTQYYSIHGRHRRSVCADRATDRETCVSCAGCGARHACGDCLRGAPVRQQCAGGA